MKEVGDYEVRMKRICIIIFIKNRLFSLIRSLWIQKIYVGELKIQGIDVWRIWLL